MCFKSFNVTRTTASAPFIELLNLESSTKLVNSGNGYSVIKLSPKIKRNSNLIRISRNSLIILIFTTPTYRTNLLMPLFIGKIKRIPKNHTISTSARSYSIITRSHNGCITKLSSLQGHIHTLLRGWETGCHIIPEFIGNKWKSTFSYISRIRTGIHTSNSGIVNRNLERVSQILIAKPFVHNKRIRAEGESIHAQTRHASRNTHIVSNSTNFPACTGRGGKLRDLILDRRNPRAFRILSHELLPMFPNQTIGNKEVIRIEIDVIHNRSKKRLHTDDLRRTYLERITRENFVNIEGNDLTNIECRLMAKIARETRSRHIQTDRVSSKPRVSISTQFILPHFLEH